MKRPRYILLDLGGVLYGVDYYRTTQALGLENESLPVLLQDPLLAAYEKGAIRTNAFLTAWQERFPHLSQASLIEAWNAMLLGPLPDAESTLRALSQQYPIAILSNTNDLHLEVVEPAIAPWKKYCIAYFFSNRLGRRKPDPDTYRYVLSRLGWRPEETLFVDDSALNVKGAKEAGLLAQQIPANHPKALFAYAGLSPA